MARRAAVRMESDRGATVMIASGHSRAGQQSVGQIWMCVLKW